MKPPSVMKLSPGIYSKKESYKTESHKANLTSADPEGGGQGVRTPLENHKLYGFL